MNDKLNFGDHIKILENKVARGVGLLTKLKHFFPQTILLQLYHILVPSSLLYGIIIRENTFPTYARKLNALQNRAIKVISVTHFRNAVKLIYVQYKILQIDDLYKLEVAKMVYCCIHNKAPSSLLNYFIKVKGVSDRLTRASSYKDSFTFLYVNQRDCRGVSNIGE